MTKLNVLFDAGPIIQNAKTGIGYYTEQLIESLVYYNPNSLSLSGYYFDFLGTRKQKANNLYRFKRRPIRFVPGKLLSAWRKTGTQPFLEMFVPVIENDVLLFTNYVSLPSIKKRPTALIVYDLSFLDCPEFVQGRNLDFLRRFCPPSVRQADLIITISHFTKDRIQHYFPDLKAKIIVTPIPPAHNNLPKRPLSQKLDDMGVKKNKYILYLGTIEPRKNINNLITAYAKLPHKIQDEYSLVLAGGKGWNDEAILGQIAELKGKGLSIIQTGYISDEDKDALFANASCFVLPSHYEGFGMPILEAMQYSIPIAVSDIPVFHEVAGSVAQYFDKDDPLDIAAKINGVLTNPPAHEILAKSSKEQLQKFSWEKNSEIVAKALLDISK